MLKLRPFDETCEAEISHIKGDIIQKNFILTLDAANYAIPTLEVHKDHHGIFAIVEEGIIELGFEYFIRIEPEYGSKASLSGCAISFEKRKNATDVHSILIDSCINIDNVNLLNRNSDPFMILYFGPSGAVNGKSFPKPNYKTQKDTSKSATSSKAGGLSKEN